MNKKEVKKTNNKKKQSPLLTIQRSIGQKAADWLAKSVGSWTFIVLILILISGWIYLNITAYVKSWDPWPFIILNLVLSCLAALQAPIILMSQNRSAERDRQRAEYDYAVNRKAARELQDVDKQLDRIERKIDSLKKK